MKNKALKIILLIVIIGLALAVAGMLVYEIVVKQDTSSIPKAAILLVSLILSAVRLITGRGRRARLPLAAYRKHYAHVVGNAFAGDPKQEKIFLQALEAYATDQSAKALKLLDRLTPSYQSYDDRFAIIMFRALCYDDMKLYPQAIELYEQALQMRDHSTAASNMGLCYQNMGKYEDAIHAYERAVAIDPTSAYPYNNIAQLYIRMGDFEQALSFAGQAAELNNNMYQAHSAQAICYAMMGDREQYEKALQRAVACGADKNNIRYLLYQMDAPIQ
jgi:tetratricopeptide (TPR) repeat protein